MNVNKVFSIEPPLRCATPVADYIYMIEDIFFRIFYVQGSFYITVSDPPILFLTGLLPIFYSLTTVIMDGTLEIGEDLLSNHDWNTI